MDYVTGVLEEVENKTEHKQEVVQDLKGKHILNSNTKYIFGILNFDYVSPFKSLFEAKEETK